MKDFLIICALLVGAQASDPIFSYIHGGGDECESSFIYSYNLTSLNDDVRVKFSVDVLVRSEEGHSNSLLFFFKNYQLQTYENPKHSNGEREISTFPARVTYDDSGRIAKVEFNPEETDASFHLKRGIIHTLQLDWKEVQAKMASSSHDEFESTLIKPKEYKVITHVHQEADKPQQFCVHVNRDANYMKSGDSEKAKESKKSWLYHFDLEKAKNFEHLTINIDDHFPEKSNILIKSGFVFQGCNAKEGEWDASNLQEFDRPFPTHNNI